MEVDSVGIIANLSMSYITTRIVKTDKCGNNSQSTRRKSNYHTTCGKNCHKIFSVWIQDEKKMQIQFASIWSKRFKIVTNEDWNNVSVSNGKSCRTKDPVVKPGEPGLPKFIRNKSRPA